MRAHVVRYDGIGALTEFGHHTLVHDWANSNKKNKNVEKSSIFVRGRKKLPLSLSRVGR